MITIKHHNYCCFTFTRLGDLFIATPDKGCKRVRPERTPRCWTKHLPDGKARPETDARMIDTLEAGVTAMLKQTAGPHGKDGYLPRHYDAPGQPRVGKRARESEGSREE